MTPEERNKDGERRYRTIVADPPWPIYSAIPRWGEKSGAVRCPYDVMELDEIAALPVRAFADRDCDLYLWTINDWLAESFNVLSTWGFTHSATLVWCKPRKGAGLGGKFPSDVEFVQYATRRGPNAIRKDERVVAARLRDEAERCGKPRSEIDRHFGTKNISGHWFTPDGATVHIPTVEQWRWLRGWFGVDDAELDNQIAYLNARKGERVAPPLARADGRWFTWPRAEHSRKPDAFLDLVEQVSPGPYLELFARRQRLGWDTWGNEALEHVSLEAS